MSELSAPDSTFDYAIAVATFDPGAKLDWHIHPGGQILLIIDGTGYYQERGKPIQTVHKRQSNQVPSRCGALARSHTDKWASPIWQHIDSKGKDSLARARSREGLSKVK